jgi:hypothetical protein
MAESLIDALKQDRYRVGCCQAVVYDRKNLDLFPVGYLANLYFQLSGNCYTKREGTGHLARLFCGISDLSFDSIVGYLASKPMIVVGVWGDEGRFETAGFGFVQMSLGVAPERMAFCGYSLLRPYWGHKFAEVLTMLGLACLFGEMGLKYLHGVRAVSNVISDRFLAQFGFKNNGTVPGYMLEKGVLVPAVASTLTRADFEQYLERKFLEAMASQTDRQQ